MSQKVTKVCTINTKKCMHTHVCAISLSHTHIYIHAHNLIVGPQGGGWGQAEASRVPSITPLSESEGKAGRNVRVYKEREKRRTRVTVEKKRGTTAEKE